MWIAVCLGVAIGLFLALQLLLFLVSFSPAIAWMLDKNIIAFLKDVIGPVSAGFGGAVAGAYAAFRFQSNSEKRKELKTAERALHMAKLNLMQKLNDLASIKKYNVFPHRNHRARFIVIPELPESPGVRDPIGLGVIDLLIAAKQGDLINLVLLADQRYEACFQNFKARNKALLDYRAVINASEIGKTIDTSLGQICKYVEPGRLVALHVNTEVVLEAFDEAVDTLNSVLTGLSSALDKSFKGMGLTVMKIGGEEEDGKYLEKLPPSHFDVKSLKEFIEINRQG